MNKEQKKELIMLIEEYAYERANHHFVEDQGTTSLQVKQAKINMECAKSDLYDFIEKLHA